MNFFDPKNAEEWEASGRIPRGNNDIEEGLKYFQIHQFNFSEERGYSQVGDYAGYQDIPGGVEAWQTLLDTWEHHFAPFFLLWQGRSDMRVRSIRQQEAVKGRASKHLPDIINSLHNYRFSGPHVPWDAYRERIAEFEKEKAKPFEWRYKHYYNPPQVQASFAPQRPPGMTLEEVQQLEAEDKKMHDESLRKRTPRMGDVEDVATLSAPRLRVQTLAFVRDIDATLTHYVLDESYEVSVRQAKLAVWVETEINRNELSWRWLGAIYSWKNCSMMPLDYCNESTKRMLNQMVMPLVREWTQLVRQVSKGSALTASNAVSFRDNMEL